MKDIAVDVEHVKEMLKKAALMLYQTHRSFTPMYPWVLVHVLPKEQQVGSIVLPEKQQKPNYEGIVLATWQPYTEEVGIQGPDGTKRTRTIQRKSAFDVGDHVLFPHFAGLPVGNAMDERTYRIVKEHSTDMNDCIFGVIDHAVETTNPGQVLRDMLAESLQGEDADAHQLASTVAAQIEDQFLLVDRDWRSITLSGK